MEEVMLAHSWTCACCGKQHDELPVRWATPTPDYYDAIPEADREARAELLDDFCSVDGEHFFIRGLHEIPIIGREETFGWGVWTTLSKASIETVQDAWERPDRDSIGPFFGWLNTSLEFYPETINLKTHVHINPPPFIPSIELEPTDHPLAVEQRRGMTLQRAIEIAEALLPRH
jgi:hypothetical protein